MICRFPRLAENQLKEHSGGTPNIGYEIPIAAWDEESYPVAIEQFKFHELDKPEDFIIEAVKQGRDISPLLKCFVDQISAIKAATKIAALLHLMLESKQPRMVAEQIVWATSMDLLGGASISVLAKKYGISKQAFEQGALRICAELSLRPTRHMRSGSAKQNMSNRNYRKVKTNG